jgi:hypothetical protein
MEENQLSFDMAIRAVQNQTKINMGQIIEKYKVIPKHKAWMHAPLCKMVPMHAFKI